MRDRLTPHRRVYFYLLIFLCLLTLSGNVLRRLSMPSYAAAALCSLFSAGTVLLLYRRRRRPRTKYFYRLNKITFREAVFWFFLGIGANCAGAVINVPLSLFWRRFFDTSPGIAPPQNAGEYLLGVVCIAAVPAVCEELLCRGLVLREYERYSNAAAVFGSAAAFSLLHNSVPNLVFTFLLGLALALIAIKTGSLYPAMLFHFSVNFFSMTMSFISQTLIPPHIQPQFSLVLNFTYIFLALTFVVLFSVFLAGAKTVRPALKVGRPRLGFSISLLLILCWFAYSQTYLILK